VGLGSGIPADVNSFVGRAALVDQALRLLSIARLLTLAGPGGVGKTRLAFEVARHARDSYEQVAVARLAELKTQEAVERSLVNALDIVDQPVRPPVEVLVEHLRGRRVLLVLDNCEHLWEVVGDVTTLLLEHAPGVAVVTTSRRHLEVFGERVLMVPPLDIPAADASYSTAMTSDAMVLVLDRIGAASQVVEDWHAMVELVRWSGGLPLVLELIAVRLAAGMPPAAIMARLDGGRILTARRARPHHRTLRHVLDWSCGLCDPGEQRLWARLSVFAGSFDLGMAEEVCGDGMIEAAAIMDLLSGLVRQSIVIATAGERFHQLQPIKEYGHHLLTESGELALMRERHGTFVARLAADAAEQWFGPAELDWLRRIELELPNIRAALDYCGTPERAEAGLCITTNITRSRLPFFAALLGEFCSRFDLLLALTPTEPTPVRINAVVMLGWIRICQGDHERGRICYEECVGLGSADNPAVLFLEGAYLLLARADPTSIHRLREAREAFLNAGASGDAYMARLFLAIATSFLGSVAEATRSAAECRADAEVHHAPWAISWAQWAEGLAIRKQPVAALELVRRCLRTQVHIRDRWGPTWSSELIAWLWAAQGLVEPAARLLGGTTGAQQRTGVRITGLVPLAHERDEAVARARTRIGAETFDATVHSGTTLSDEQVHALALSLVPDDDNDDGQSAVTPRQWEIARLVARGSSNKDIAATLNLSPRTVENHLRQIFTQLDVRNRAQLAAWVIEHHG
jgi:predicted ATPase/DNA-binding CsgD family transcriptional regulator